jgi:acyl-CoA reductase-like NAD-dependent aldehyde dehydrogenase
VQLHLDDALAAGPGGAVAAAMGVFGAHAGQACSAQTRMLVPPARKAEVLDAVAATAASMTVGDPQSSSTRIGPLITETHRARVERLVAEGVEAGARLVTGGRRPEHLERGWYYLPTVLDIDDNSNPVAQQEVFGPVLTVQAYDDVDEAVAIANDTEYGLSGAVYTGDLQRGIDIAARIRSGTVQVNMACASAYTPMGGYKQSGIGRERGVPGIRAFQETKHVVVGGR